MLFSRRLGIFAGIKTYYPTTHHFTTSPYYLFLLLLTPLLLSPYYLFPLLLSPYHLPPYYSPSTALATLDRRADDTIPVGIAYS